MLMEFWFDRVERGVPGIPPGVRGTLGSELCRRRDRANKPPKLGLPAEEDVLVEASIGNCGKSSS